MTDRLFAAVLAGLVSAALAQLAKPPCEGRRRGAPVSPAGIVITVPRGASIVLPLGTVRPFGFTRVMEVPGLGILYRKD